MSNPTESILEIIKSIDSQPNVNPTEIYNEGWMTRLLVYYSIKDNLTFKGISFYELANWTSEALISSPFVGAKKKKEGYTHADMALGDFTVDYETDGKINAKSAKTFGLIEAKMRSGLSIGTTNAPTYDQASRNVACIAENTSDTCITFFYVLAPKSRLDLVHRNGKRMIDIVERKAIKEQINLRIKLHNEQELNTHISTIEQNKIIERVSRCKIDTITYEEWIDAFRGKEAYDTINKFYDSCKKWNKIK